MLIMSGSKYPVPIGGIERRRATFSEKQDGTNMVVRKTDWSAVNGKEKTFEQTRHERTVSNIKEGAKNFRTIYRRSSL